MTILDRLADYARRRTEQAKRKTPLAALERQALSMPKGNFAFEAALYGAPAAWANVGFNTLQCLVGAAAAHVLALAVRAAAGGSR